MSVFVEVQGMTCGHCVAAISAAVTPISGVTDVVVDLTAGTVSVAGPADERAVVTAIEDAGYDVEGVRAA